MEVPDSESSAAVLVSLRQLKHQHDVLLKEKRNMELYCQEVEADMQTKDSSIESLSREVQIARRAIEEKERLLEEERATARQLKFEASRTPEKRRRRSLPQLPGHALIKPAAKGAALATGNADNATANDADIAYLQKHVIALQTALDESREAIRQRAPIHDEDAAGSAFEEAPEVMSLRDELMLACQTMDNGTVLDLARRFHEKTEELSELQKVEELLREENIRLAEENLVLRDGYEGSELERSELEVQNLKLSDDLDEALGYLDALRAAEDSTKETQAALSIDEEQRTDKVVKELSQQLDDEKKRVAKLEKEASEAEEQMQELRQQIQDVVTAHHADTLKKSAMEASLQQALADARKSESILDARLDDVEQSTQQVMKGEALLKEAEERADKLDTQVLELRTSLEISSQQRLELEELLAVSKKEALDTAERVDDELKRAKAEAGMVAARAAHAEGKLLQQIADTTSNHATITQRLRDQLADAIKSRQDTEEMLVAAEALAAKNARDCSAASDEVRQLKALNQDVLQQLEEERAKRTREASQHDIVREGHQAATTKAELFEAEVLTLSQRLETAERQLATAADRATTLTTQLAEVETTHKIAAARAAKATETTQKRHAAEMESLKVEVNDYSARISSVMEDRDRQHKEIEQLRSEIKMATALRGNDAKAVSDLSAQLRDAAQKMEAKTNKLHDAEMSAIQLSTEVGQLKSCISLADRRVEQLQSALQGAEKQRETTLASLRSRHDEAGKTISSEIKRLKERVDGVRDNVNSIEITLRESDDIPEQAVTPLLFLTTDTKDNVQEVSLAACTLDALLVNLFEQHRAEVSGLILKIKTLDQQSAELSAEKADMAVANETLTSKLDVVTNEVRELKKRAEHLAQECVVYNSTIKVLQDRLRDSENELERALDEMKEAHRSARNSESSVAQLEASVEAVGRDLSRKLTSLGETEAACAELEEKCAQLAVENAELTCALEKQTDETQTKKDLEVATAKIKAVQEQVSQLQQEVLAKSQEVERAKANATLNLDALQKEKAETERLRLQIGASRATAQDEESRLIERLKAKEDELGACTSQIESARNDAISARAAFDNTAAELFAAKEEEQKLNEKLISVHTALDEMTTEMTRYKEKSSEMESTIMTTAESETLLNSALALKEKENSMALARLAVLEGSMQQTEEKHKRTIGRILERADAEIHKHKARLAALQRAVQESDRKEIQKPNLARQFDAANDLSQLLESALGMKSTVPISLRTTDATANQIDAVCARMEYARHLVKLLASRKQKSMPDVQAVDPTEPPTRRRVKTLTDSIQQSEGGGGDLSAVDRLLSAVKKFYDAKDGHEVDGEVFAPTDHADESMDDPACLQPERSLTDSEQNQLFQDWCRLKSKVRKVIKQLVAAKAAVAFLRYQDEQTKVYARNRDRLLQQLITKLGGKKKARQDLLKILSETSV